jgi:hypothetical protein
MIGVGGGNRRQPPRVVWANEMSDLDQGSKTLQVKARNFRGFPVVIYGSSALNRFRAAIQILLGHTKVEIRSGLAVST